MSISTLTRPTAGSLLRSLWNRSRGSSAARRSRRAAFRPDLDQLESRFALALPGALSIGGTTVASFTDAPTSVSGDGSLGDFVTVSITGSKGTAVINGGAGVADGGTIQSIEIKNASPDFQLTFNALIQTANPVPYGSDGIVQIGTISTTNVIRGINTVRGPATNVATLYPPIGFTTVTAGGPDITLSGNQTSTFPADKFVSASPLVPSVGSAVFSKVSTSSYNSGTDTTSIKLGLPTGKSATSGALSTAETRNVEFQLTKFTGVNFSNQNLKNGGGLFVDTVLGDVAGVGIVLSGGLLNFSTIGIRKRLGADMILGTASKASVDGRVFIQSATDEKNTVDIVVGPQTAPMSPNSKFQLYGGDYSLDVFNANVTVNQPFAGVVNIPGVNSGTFIFNKGVAAPARLNAAGWNDVRVKGDFAGVINSLNAGVDGFASDVSLSVSRNVTGTARISSYSNVTLSVGGSVIKGAVVSADSDISLDVGGSVAGTLQGGGGEIYGQIKGGLNGATLAATTAVSLTVGGSIVNSKIAAREGVTLTTKGSITGSTISAGSDDMDVSVGGNVVNSTFTTGYDYDLSLTVGGNVTGTTIQAYSDVTADIAGNVSKSQFISTTGDVSVFVGGSLTDSKLVSADSGVTLTTGGSALNVKIVADDNDSTLLIGRNFSGTVQSGYGDLYVGIAGAVLAGSTFTNGGDAAVNVQGNFDGSVTTDLLEYRVGGNVSQASRIVARTVTDWTGWLPVPGRGPGPVLPNFTIGGQLAGIVNVGTFDAAPNADTVTLVGGGATTEARFYVDRFETDNLVFRGNFYGNVRVLQDLRANLIFSGDVNRIDIGGRVGSYALDENNNVAVNPFVTIAVGGRLLYLNSNSYFEATVPGKSGLFWNDATKTSPPSGQLLTGSYVDVVPLLQQVPAPPAPTPQTYTAPSAPTSFSAQAKGPNASDGILVSFSAPTSDGGLPVVYYEYSTDATAGSPSWRRFDNPAQGPGSNIQLTTDSAGGAWIPGNTYQVAVRAVNAIGNTATSATPVTLAVT